MPIKTKKELSKKNVKRATVDVAYKDDIVLAAWKDNKPMYVASNKYGASTRNNTAKC